MSVPFKDCEGRGWSLRFDVGLLARIREATGVELGRLHQEAFRRLLDLSLEPVLLVRVLWVACEKQAGEAGVSPEEFGRGLAGDAIEEAFLALREAWLNFCPSRLATPLRATAAKIAELEAARERAITELISKQPSGGGGSSGPTSSDSVGSSVGPAGLTRVDLPSAS